MRVLALMTEAFGARGGIQEFNRHWLRGLAAGPASQIQVLVTAGPKCQRGTISQQPVDGKLAYFAEARRRHQSGPDLIICGHLSLLPAAAWLARSKGTPVWLQLHGIEAWNKPKGLLRRSGLGSVSLVSAVSRYTRQKFLGWSNLADHRVRILPNTVSEDCFESPPSSAADEDYLLSVGRLDGAERYKGHDQVIKALPGLRRDYPNLRYRVAGSGDDLPRLQALAHQYQVAQAVEFMPGLGRAEILDAYRRARLFVLPSRGEGFGIVFLEALACGCPVLGLGQDGSADPLSISQGTHLAGSDLQHSIATALDPATQSLPDPAQVRQRFGLPAFRAQVADLASQAMAR